MTQLIDMAKSTVDMVETLRKGIDMNEEKVTGNLRRLRDERGVLLIDKHFVSLSNSWPRRSFSVGNKHWQ